MNFRLLYPGFHKKAVTFSYDDGILEDRKLIEILNRHHFKGTFNLNAGLSGVEKIRKDKFDKDIDCSHIVLEDNISLYDGHEISNHTFTHPHLEDISKEEQKKEYLTNTKELETLFHKKVNGSAYPYGSYDRNTFEVLRQLGVEYARTTRSTYSFSLPYDWLLWNPTIHHRDGRIDEILDLFLKDDSELSLLYIWGHAYEFAIDHDFDAFDGRLSRLSGNEDIISMTNHEIYEYAHAANKVYYRYGAFHNPSDMDVFINVDDKNILIQRNGDFPYDGTK